MTRGVAAPAFPKELRLLRRAEFRRVYGEGRRRSNSLCTLFFKPNGLPQTRLGITTPVRLGKAVKRNRIRRRLREIFRLHRQGIAPGWDIILNPRDTVACAPFEHLASEVLKLFPPLPPGK